MLFGICAWGLLFLVIFIYFTDNNSVEPVPSAFSYLEDKKLLPIQGKQRAIMGAPQDPSLSYGIDENSLVNEDILNSFKSGPGSLKTIADVENYFESEDEFIMSKKKKSLVRRDSNQAVRHRQNSHSRHRKIRRNVHRSKQHMLEESDEWNGFSSTMSKSFLQKLWKGNVSSKMLTPRLQKARREYLRANKLGVSFSGKQNSRKLSAQELLCILKKRAHVRMLDGKEAPFSNLGWEKYFPQIPLNKLYPKGFSTCAVVSSAGAILNSSLGAEIGKFLFWC